MTLLLADNVAERVLVAGRGIDAARQGKHRENHQGDFHRPILAPYLRGVQIPDLARYWPIAEPMLARLLPYAKGRYTLADLRASVESGKRWLWLSEPDRACAVLTQITEYPQMDVLVIFAIAGRLPPGWRARLASLESHARSIGCKQVEVWGRKGWERKLADYDPGQIVMTKVL